MTLYIRSLLILVFLAGFALKPAAAEHALSMHGAAKYKSDFTHFAYSNPNAVRGGHLRLPVIGSFDSLQPFLVKGVAARGLGLVYQSLMTRAKDEPFTLYPNIAKSVQTDEGRHWIRFDLDPDARFSDGSPITPEDIQFSFESLRDKGRPNHRHYYGLVERVKINPPQQITFIFQEGAGREMPLIIGLMPILSKSYFQKQPFDKTSLKIPLGTGPYKVETVDAGKSITYKRSSNFWGDQKAVYRGRYNFERITFDYFRDIDIAFQAFKNKDLDVFFETDPGKWVRRKTQTEGVYKSHSVDLNLPPPMRAITMNSRRPLFKSRNVRRAFLLAYDFEWLNDNILHRQYTRTTSFFGAGNLQATGLPGPEERRLLTPFKAELPKAVFQEAVQLPRSDGSGRIRTRLKKARQLLQDAGFQLRNGRLINPETDAPLTVEIIYNDSDHLKLFGNFKKNLQKLGIELKARELDDASYQNRITQFDFELMVSKWGQSLSPGNEQQFYWSTQAAQTPGSRNYPGIENAAVDHLVQQIATAETRTSLEIAVRALDRVLMSGCYVIPLYHAAAQWIYTTPEIQFPEIPSNYGITLDLWWWSADPVDD